MGMAQEVSVIVRDDDRPRLEAIVGDRNQRQKHMQRARIVLLSADRLPVAAVARQAGVSRPAVWRWQRRFAEQGVSGVLRDQTRPPGTPPLPDETVARVVAMTCAEPPGEATVGYSRPEMERRSAQRDACSTIRRSQRSRRRTGRAPLR